MKPLKKILNTFYSCRSFTLLTNLCARVGADGFSAEALKPSGGLGELVIHGPIQRRKNEDESKAPRTNSVHPVFLYFRPRFFLRCI